MYVSPAREASLCNRFEEVQGFVGRGDEVIHSYINRIDQSYYYANCDCKGLGTRLKSIHVHVSQLTRHNEAIIPHQSPTCRKDAPLAVRSKRELCCSSMPAIE